MANDRKCKILTINLLESGKSLRDVAAQFVCGRTQISRIKSGIDLIMTEWQSGGRSNLKYVKKRKTTYEALNNTVCKGVVREGQIQESPNLWQIESGKNCLNICPGCQCCKVVREKPRTANQYKLYPNTQS